MTSKCLAVAKLLQRSRPLMAAASPFAARLSFCSSTSAADYPMYFHSSRKGSLRKTLVGRMNHPFLHQGLGALGNVEEYEREAIVKIDMPGIGKEGVSIQIRNNAIHVEAKAEKKDEDEDDRRVRMFSGVLDLPPGFYDTDQIKASMQLGVLKMVIPKLESTFSPVPAIEFRGWGPMYDHIIPVVD